jgi:hypothetical protein
MNNLKKITYSFLFTISRVGILVSIPFFSVLHAQGLSRSGPRNQFGYPTSQSGIDRNLRQQVELTQANWLSRFLTVQNYSDIESEYRKESQKNQRASVKSIASWDGFYALNHSLAVRSDSQTKAIRDFCIEQRKNPELSQSLIFCAHPQVDHIVHIFDSKMLIMHFKIAPNETNEGHTQEACVAALMYEDVKATLHSFPYHALQTQADIYGGSSTQHSRMAYEAESSLILYRAQKPSFKIFPKGVSACEKSLKNLKARKNIAEYRFGIMQKAAQNHRSPSPITFSDALGFQHQTLIPIQLTGSSKDTHKPQLPMSPMSF